MTACVNKKSKRVAAVVTASLVGALSIGAPAVALAANGVELLGAEDAATAFSQGTITLGSSTKEYDGQVFKPTITNITTKGGVTVKGDTINSSTDYKVYYTVADGKGNPTDELVAEPVEVGTYCLVIEAVDGDFAGGKAFVKFTITGNSMAGATEFFGDDLDNVDAPQYDAEPVEIGFKANGVELVSGVDHTVKYYTAGQDYNNPEMGSETAPTDHGTYFARLTGIGAYAGQAVNVEFSIAQCDLTTANIYVADVIGANTALPTAPTTVNGSAVLASKLKLQYNQSAIVGELRDYKPDVLPVKDKDSNFKNTGKAPFNKVATGVTFTYGGEAMPAEMLINLSKKEKFDISKVEATYVDADGETQTVAMRPGQGQYSVTYSDDEGGSVSADDLNNPGTYVVTFKVIPNNEFSFGGSASVKVTVTSGVIDCDASLFVKFNDKIVTSVESTYDGSDLTDKIKATLYNGKNPVNTPDYEIVYKDADGKVVTSIKDAGKYTLNVESDKYTIENPTVDITVNKKQVLGVRIATATDAGASDGKLIAINGQYVLKYDNGNAISPVPEFTDGSRNADGTLAWTAFDSSTGAFSNAVISYTKDGKTVKQVKDKGNYVLSVKASAATTSKNYEFKAADYKFVVDSENEKFQDVSDSDWFYSAVNKAASNNYINGIGGSKVFAPNKSITRADVCGILFNMATPSKDSGTIVGELGQYDKDFGYVTGFSDVDGNAYYAMAVAWAEKSGVVNGYGDGTFRPDQNVTREDFAAMLSNYANLCGKFQKADSDKVLATFPDGAEVSDWFVDAVAWAADNHYMGNGGELNPTDAISRAEVATMAVNFQPAKLS